jgi:pectinesterase
MKVFINILLIFLIFNFKISFSQKVFDIVVAKDGSGDYTNISTAISRYSNNRKVIFIKNGTYKEKIAIDASKTNLSLIGENVDSVIITYDDYAGKSSSVTSTAQSYTFKVEANGFYAENITFQNTATQAQAVALYSTADTLTFKNCRILGYQDTHYANKGRQYFYNCETRGDVDFIFGSAALVYDNCKIICRNRKGGYITAPSDAAITSQKVGGGTFYHGILIKNSEILAETGLGNNTCYLGRPWNVNSSSVFYNCKIGSHIKPEGWSVWSTDPSNDGYNNHLYTYFAEYKSLNLNGVLLDVSNRVTWSKQLTDNDTAFYSIDYYFKGWKPLKINSPEAPKNIRIINDTLFWNNIEGVRGYVVFINDTFTAATLYNSFYLNNIKARKIIIKSVGKYGNLSAASDIASFINNNFHSNDNIYCYNKILYVPENKFIEVFDITGRIILKTQYLKEIHLNNFNNGLYVIRLTDIDDKRIITKKILIQ